jgi:signal transduction histidine kinase
VCGLLGPVTRGSAQVLIDSTFSSALVVPTYWQDTSRAYRFIDQVLADSSVLFQSTGTPYFSFGPKGTVVWLHFQLKNLESKRRTVILFAGRKYIRELSVWKSTPKDTASPFSLEGTIQHADQRYRMNMGYDFAVRLDPGDNHFWVRMDNPFAVNFQCFEVYEMGEYAKKVRKDILVFGVFLGVIFISSLFSIVLFSIYRKRLYLYYFAYMATMLAREMYNYSLDGGWISMIDRQCLSLLMGITFALFMSEFLNIRAVSKRIQQCIYICIFFWVVCIIFCQAVYHSGHFEHIKTILFTANIFFFVFAVCALLYSLPRFLKDRTARIFTVGYMPLGIVFLYILARNLGLFPSQPFLQQAVMFGFVAETLIYSIAFTRWYRILESDNRLLGLRLELERNNREISISKVEQQIKDHIAKDINEHVATALAGMGTLNRVAHNQMAQTIPEAIPILEQIGRTIKSTSETVSDLIWAVRANPDYLNDLADRMRDYSGRLLGASNIELQLNIPRHLPVLLLSLEERRNIYLIFKEGLNNALKHSGCTEIEVAFYVENECIALKIIDNGHGFDPKKSRQGLGLKSMKNRAAQIGGYFELSTGVQKGTMLIFTLPFN